MIRLFAAVAIFFFAVLGVLWVLGLVSPQTAQDLLMKGGGVLAVIGLATAALWAVSRAGKK